jgi:hypothetical protein
VGGSGWEDETRAGTHHEEARGTMYAASRTIRGQECVGNSSDAARAWEKWVENGILQGQREFPSLRKFRDRETDFENEKSTAEMFIFLT